jgi:DNA-binding response OmpR family regulator
MATNESVGDGSLAYGPSEVQRLRQELASSHAVIETLKALVPREGQGRLVRVGNVTLDARTVETRINGARPHLSFVKFRMLFTLGQADGKIVPAAGLLAFSRRDARDAHNLVSAHISQLRKFLSHHGADVVILSVRCAGYRLLHERVTENAS